MPFPDADRPQPEGDPDQPAVGCGDCQSVFRAAGRQSVSFLLLDQLTIPVMGCEAHLEQFASICELSTTDDAQLLEHRPAGGIQCPGCRLAPRKMAQPMIAIQDGAVAVIACSRHQSAIIDRFQTGLETREQLATDLSPTTDPDLSGHR